MHLFIHVFIYVFIYLLIYLLFICLFSLALLCMYFSSQQASAVLAMVSTLVMKVKSMKRATRGTVAEVGGRILDTSSRNTIRASRIDIDIMIFSRASAGR